MQPIFLSFASGVAYRKIVKLHFRSISTIDHLVSISNCSPKVAKLLFLTAGNKSYCGTLQRLTHPQQSTDSPILEPVSPAKRQVPQGKPFTLSSARPRTSPHRHMPRATPRATHPTTPLHHMPHHTAAPRTPPRHAPHHTPAPHTPTPHLPSISHAIPPGPHSSTAQKPRNINDPTSKLETFSGELHAKLLRMRSQGPADRTRSEATAGPAWPAGQKDVAAAPVGGSRPPMDAPPNQRPPRGLQGLAGQRVDAPSEARSADGERAGRPRGGRRSGGQSNAGNQAGPQQRRKSGGPQQAAPRAAAAQ